jgi:hypothetical protein
VSLVTASGDLGIRQTGPNAVKAVVDRYEDFIARHHVADVPVI